MKRLILPVTRHILHTGPNSLPVVSLTLALSNAVHRPPSNIILIISFVDNIFTNGLPSKNSESHSGLRSMSWCLSASIVPVARLHQLRSRSLVCVGVCDILLAIYVLVAMFASIILLLLTLSPSLNVGTTLPFSLRYPVVEG